MGSTSKLSTFLFVGGDFGQVCYLDQTSYLITSPVEKLCNVFVSAKYRLFYIVEIWYLLIIGGKNISCDLESVTTLS